MDFNVIKAAKLFAPFVRAIESIPGTYSDGIIRAEVTPKSGVEDWVIYFKHTHSEELIMLQRWEKHFKLTTPDGESFEINTPDQMMGIIAPAHA